MKRFWNSLFQFLSRRLAGLKVEGSPGYGFMICWGPLGKMPLGERLDFLDLYQKSSGAQRKLLLGQLRQNDIPYENGILPYMRLRGLFKHEIPAYLEKAKILEHDYNNLIAQENGGVILEPSMS